MSDTPDILKKIIARKVVEIRERCEQVNLREMSERAEHADPVRGFEASLRAKIESGQPAVIAEIKKASPSKGILRENFDPRAIAESYQAGGAACLSVLTDRDFFQGCEAFLQQARSACTLPVIRKDFIVDAYQVYEARSIGSDCILLIISALGDATLAELFGLGHHLEMDVLVEVHNREEMERALELGAELIGINNRDLRTFEVKLDTTLNMLSMVPDKVLLVTESGIHSTVHVSMMRENGVNAFLVGEAFMRADDPGKELATLFG